MQHELSPPRTKIWGGIFKDYYRSFFALIIVFIQHYIRNFDVTIPHIRAGFAISWVIFGICMFTMRGTLLKAASLLFMSVMAYTYLDNVAMDSKHIDSGDLYLLASNFVATLLWLLYEYRKDPAPVNKKEMNSVVTLLLIIALIIAGRNYLQYYPGVFHLINWQFDLYGGPFYKSDAAANIIAALLFMYNTRRLDMFFGFYYLVMACFNYQDEMYGDPTVQSPAEWLASIIIHIAFTAGLLWYLRRRLLPAYRDVY